MIILFIFTYFTLHFTTPNQLTGTLLFNEFSSRVMTFSATHVTAVRKRIARLRTRSTGYTKRTNFQVSVAITWRVTYVNHVFGRVLVVIGVGFY